MPPSFTCFLKVKSRTFIKDAVKKLAKVSEDPRLSIAINDLTDSGLNHLLIGVRMKKEIFLEGREAPMV